MLSLSYTGARTFGAPQPVPALSLGGYPGCSPFGNDLQGSMFPAVSYSTLKTNRPEYLALMLVNCGNTPVTNLTHFFVYDDSDVRQTMLEVGVEVPGIDSQTGRAFIGRVPGRHSRPHGVSFVEAGAAYDHADLEIVAPATAGSTITVLGLTTDVLTADQSSVQGNVMAIMSAYMNSDDYSAEPLRLRGSFTYNGLRFRRKAYGHWQGSLTVSSTSPGFVAKASDFSGGKYSPVSLPDLQPDGMLGLWYRRTLLPEALAPVEPAKMLERHDEKFQPARVNTYSLVFDYD